MSSSKSRREKSKNRIECRYFREAQEKSRSTGSIGGGGNLSRSHFFEGLKRHLEEHMERLRKSHNRVSGRSAPTYSALLEVANHAVIACYAPSSPTNWQVPGPTIGG